MRSSTIASVRRFDDRDLYGLSLAIKSVRDRCKSVGSVSSVVYACDGIALLVTHRPRITLIRRILRGYQSLALELRSAPVSKRGHRFHQIRGLQERRVPNGDVTQPVRN